MAAIRSETMLTAYRWQYILSDAAHPHFREVLGSLITLAQGARIETALAGLRGAATEALELSD